jgi:putative transposase
MNQLYAVEGISKQAVHQYGHRRNSARQHAQDLLPTVRRWRSKNGGVSVRSFYRDHQPTGIGRDRFEQLCFANGLRVKRIRNAFKTTVSDPNLSFENKLMGLELTGVNQVWVSDITYYPLPGSTAYITLIMDLMSRFIVGYQVSTRLLTEHTTIPALKHAVKARHPSQGLIFHSDGGGQYFDKAFVQLTKDCHMQNSMGRSVYENANMERLHQTIKNQYIVYDRPETIEALRKSLDRVVNIYNYERKHQSLGLTTPSAYEQKSPMPSKTIESITYKTNHRALVLK